MLMAERPLWTRCFPSTFSEDEGRQTQAGLGTRDAWHRRPRGSGRSGVGDRPRWHAGWRTPTKTLQQLSFDDTVTHLRHMGEPWASLRPTHKLSTLQDVEQGKRLEVEETLGYAVRQGTALGIPTPTMDTCYKLIAGINRCLQ